MVAIKVHVIKPAQKKGIKFSTSNPQSLEPTKPNAITKIPILKEFHNGPNIVLEYFILIEAHRIEKGLSLPNPKPFFGRELFKNLSSMIYSLQKISFMNINKKVKMKKSKFEKE